MRVIICTAKAEYRRKGKTDEEEALRRSSGLRIEVSVGLGLEVAVSRVSIQGRGGVIGLEVEGNVIL